MTEPGAWMLIVDDELPIRRFLRASLTVGYAVHEASRGKEVLHAPPVVRPSLTILVLCSPYIGDTEMASHLHEGS